MKHIRPSRNPSRDSISLIFGLLCLSDNHHQVFRSAEGTPETSTFNLCRLISLFLHSYRALSSVIYKLNLQMLFCCRESKVEDGAPAEMEDCCEEQTPAVSAASHLL